MSRLCFQFGVLFGSMPFILMLDHEDVAVRGDLSCEHRSSHVDVGVQFQRRVGKGEGVSLPHQKPSATQRPKVPGTVMHPPFRGRLHGPARQVESKSLNDLVIVQPPRVFLAPASAAADGR